MQSVAVSLGFLFFDTKLVALAPESESQVLMGIQSVSVLDLGDPYTYNN